VIASNDYKRGYDAGYKQALLDAIKHHAGKNATMGGPDAPYKQDPEWRKSMGLDQ
jgi:hypothetical protein